MEPEELKIDNNVVYTLDKRTKRWIEAKTDSIEKIKKLSKRLSNIKYSGKDVYDDITFENEVVIGARSVKSFKDDDGDFTIMYKSAEKKVADEFDEDEAFGIEDSIKRVELATDYVERPINYWGASGATVVEEKKSKKGCARKSVGAVTVGYEFKKRPATIYFTPKNRLKNKMNHLFFSCKADADADEMRKLISSSAFDFKVRFKGKSQTRSECLPGMLVSQFKYENTKKIGDTFGSKFYLQVSKSEGQGAERQSDDFEDRLLKAIDL